MRALPVVSMVLFALTSGCLYDPKGEYVDPIQPPDATGTAINLSETNNPIVLGGLRSFVFTVIPSNKPRYAIEVKYDGQVVFERDEWPGPTVPFFLDPSGHPVNGELVVTAAFQSRSQSIAGQLGVEMIIVTRSWSVVVDTE